MPLSCSTPELCALCVLSRPYTRKIRTAAWGYVGYMPMPRATEVVDIMVPYSQKEKRIEGDCGSMADVGNAGAFAGSAIHGPEKSFRA